MPYADPQSTHNPTTGQVIPASWGDIIRDDLQYLAVNYPHCSIKETTAQAVTTSTWTALTSNEENYDVGGMHSTVSNTSRITVPSGEGGVYDITVAVTHAQPGGAANERFVGVGLNGATPAYSLTSDTALTSSATSQSGATSMVLAAGDFVECKVFHTRGSNLDITLNDFTVKWRST